MIEHRRNVRSGVSDIPLVAMNRSHQIKGAPGESFFRRTGRLFCECYKIALTAAVEIAEIPGLRRIQFGVISRRGNSYVPHTPPSCDANETQAFAQSFVDGVRIVCHDCDPLKQLYVDRLAFEFFAVGYSLGHIPQREHATLELSIGTAKGRKLKVVDLPIPTRVFERHLEVAVELSAKELYEIRKVSNDLL